MVLRLLSTVHRLKKTVSRKLSAANSLRGFTLIELLIVITLFGLSTSLITASYLTFEKNQRVKTAALNLKNDLRLAQNYALSGYKGVGSSLCTDTQQLIGWYVWFTNGSSVYHVGGACVPGAVPPIPIVGKDVSLPKGVTIASYMVGINENNTPGTDFFVLFQPLRNAPSFHSTPTAGTVSSFLDINSSLQYLIGPLPQGEMIITLTGNGGSYQVNVNGDSGGIGATRI